MYVCNYSARARARASRLLNVRMSERIIGVLPPQKGKVFLSVFNGFGILEFCNKKGMYNFLSKGRPLAGLYVCRYVGT